MHQGTHEQRRQRLESLIHRVIGRADVGSREKIDFSSRRAPTLLRQAFTRAIIQQWEGLVFKGCDQPFVSFDRTNRYIKMKKDYIRGLGDTADLAIVGGDATRKMWPSFVSASCPRRLSTLAVLPYLPSRHLTKYSSYRAVRA